MSSFESVDNSGAKYLNNPFLVCPISVDLDNSNIKCVVKTIFDANDNILKSTPDDKINVSVLTGGITNILYVLTFKGDQIDSDLRVIVRIYGSGTSSIVDRSVENIVFARLSILGIGPIFYGRFENGNQLKYE